jgi:hypothetical protein
MKASKKRRLRLEARIKDWESMRGESNGKVKMVNKSAFTKPGSFTK